jgi:serine/threonine-protein kinase
MPLGDVIDGKYRVDAVIAEGPSATVFRGTDEVLERPVAIKVLRSGDPERARAGARAMARLRHENVAQVHAFGVHEGHCFIVSEWIEGTSLATTIEREGRVPAAAAIAIVEKVAAALDAAQAEGVIHGNVKASNVLIGPRYRVYLTDFGTGETFEDQYALGVMTYQLLAGRPPFEAGDAGELTRLHATQAVPPLGNVSPKLEAVVGRALAKAAASRFSSCGAFATALREADGAAERSGPGILVVDDDPAIRRLFSALIADALPDAAVSTATDGLVAVEMVRAMVPDLVVLDLQMPHLNGIEFLHHLEGLPKRPRILAVSGLLGRGGAQAGGIHVGVMLRTVGVTEQLAKPVDPAAFVATVTRLVR